MIYSSGPGVNALSMTYYLKRNPTPNASCPQNRTLMFICRPQLVDLSVFMQKKKQTRVNALKLSIQSLTRSNSTVLPTHMSKGFLDQSQPYLPHVQSLPGTLSNTYKAFLDHCQPYLPHTRSKPSRYFVTHVQSLPGPISTVLATHTGKAFPVLCHTRAKPSWTNLNHTC